MLPHPKLIHTYIDYTYTTQLKAFIMAGNAKKVPLHANGG